MPIYITTREASAAWGISMRRINVLCKEGRILGAYKEGKCWMIPLGTGKPADNRFKEENRYMAKTIKKLPLPIGISDYRRACTEYYYVDKTLMIRDILDEKSQVSLFTRPRRFGKTLNMDMLRVFFEKTDEDTEAYFVDKKIWYCGDEYRQHQGKYPVIYVTFKDAKFGTWELTYHHLSHIIRNEVERHSELLSSERLKASEKEYLTRILAGKADESETAMIFLNLSKMLHEHYGTAPIMIIDEYDTPIQQGHMRGYYDQVILFMRALLSGGLKDNSHLSYGFLTGILRVAKESIFSGMNNLNVNSIMDYRYSEYFGFTKEEVREMAAYYGALDKMEELAEWYDGYHFGNTDIYNPWSVIGYFNNDCFPKAFWISTSSNDIIGEIIAEASLDTIKKLKALMQGESFVSHIDTSVIYPQIRKNPSSIFSFLLVTGYLKALRSEQPFGDDYMCEVALPNKEVSFAYSKEILSQLDYIIPLSDSMAIREAVYLMDVDMLEERIRELLMKTISYHDAANESFYHGLLLGLCAMMDSKYRVTSNRESGNGRFDIQMKPLNKRLPGILIEIKAAKDCTDSQLVDLAEDALRQIAEKRYETELLAQDVKTLIKYGIAFSGKNVSVKAETIK